MEKWRDNFSKNVRYRYQQDVFSWSIQETLKLLDVALKSHNICANQLACSIVFGCLSPRFCTGSS